MAEEEEAVAAAAASASVARRGPTADVRPSPDTGLPAPPLLPLLLLPSAETAAAAADE